mgnify:CR=1 FL=1
MLFSYRAVDKKNEIIEATVEASDQKAAVEAIRKIGYRPLAVRKAKTNSFFTTKKAPKGKKDELVVFTRQLSAMISAGVPLVRSLHSLSGGTETKLTVAIKDVADQIESGYSFADSLAQHPDLFDDIYVNMVRAGEAAGIMDDILKRLALQQEKSATIRKKVKSAMAYPKVLMGIMTLAFFGLMMFVVPQIGEITVKMSDGKGEMPGVTKVMIGISDFILGYWYILFPILGGIIFGVSRYLKTPQGKVNFDRLILKIPGVKEIITKIAVSSFTRTFSALIGAGVSVIKTLEVSSNAVGNSVYKDALMNAAKDIKNGKQLSEVLGADRKLWPEIVEQMLAVGEETGNTDTVLVKVADFYDEEVDLAIDQISNIIEPVMIVLMGAMVALVAASVMLPIANLSQNIGG